MRKLIVSKYLGNWSVKYNKHAENWLLGSLAKKTHGLISYPYMLFTTKEEAIEVSKVADIPMDYDGVMGVPITFLNKYNPEQFEIIGIDGYVENNPHYGKRFSLAGKETCARILIRRKGKSK